MGEKSVPFAMEQEKCPVIVTTLLLRPFGPWSEYRRRTVACPGKYAFFLQPTGLQVLS
jgi:hypothetical protein